MSVKLFPDTNYTGKEVSFTPNGDIVNDTQFLKFPLKSIKNDTDYCIIISGFKTFNVFFGSIDDTKNEDADGSQCVVRAVKMPTNTYKITMIVFIVLFAVMFIGSLILYFTGMMTFHSFGHGTHST